MKDAQPGHPSLKIADVIADPAASGWLRQALRTALTRDPIGAANDAEILHELLAAARRCADLSAVRC